MNAKRVEYCVNAEWIGQQLDIDIESTGLTDRELAGVVTDAALRFAERDRRLANCEFVRATGQRILYHPWNGAQFKNRCGIFGTFCDLTEDEQAALFAADSAGIDAGNGTRDESAD